MKGRVKGMDEKNTDYSAKKGALLEQGLISPQAIELITELETELNFLRKQNESFRKALRAKSAQSSRMSTKLRDALYE
ncbi:hypothetical protein ACYCS5_00930 [Paenibacillus sp. SEL3]|uniref:Transposase n=1 Tax=Paenibacillus polymyxa TaxID=1406 RepID=A0A8I1IT26_PAEPO|nr:hypothetical protein G9G53_09255 [Paenibacillus sp. EKM206P]KAF6590114.1 hypothetical protein G9G52_05075 [Paenibacillus sp. EKM205P]MBM0632538.1 hypothetical protein [Paenibacillus polymyxa]